MDRQYVWLIWSTAFLLPWLGLYLVWPQHREVMWRTSLMTMVFGLTEPLFVPEYWHPPSLFGLAESTGFDVESLIFTFGIGGVGAVLYNVLTGRSPAPFAASEKDISRHRWHRPAVLAPAIAFPPLYWMGWNPIYAAITALVAGAAAAVLCRPDLAVKTMVGGGLFAVYYFVFMLALVWSAPGYIDAVWNLPALSGVSIVGIPLEELLFGASFGMYWSAVYEHLAWHRTLRTSAIQGSESPR